MLYTTAAVTDRNTSYFHSNTYVFYFTAIDIYFYSSCTTFLTQRQRSIWHQCKKYINWGPTDDSPTDLSFAKIQMPICPQGVVGSTSCLVLVRGFSESADQMVLFPVWPNPRFKWRYLRDESIHSVFGFRWGFRGRRIEWCYFELDHIQQVCGRKQCARSN